MRKIALFMVFFSTIALSVLAQNRTVTGLVIDANGQPLAGVSVSARGERVGTQTNIKGEFNLAIPTSVKQLVVSSVGYATETVAVGSGSQLVITLKETANSLDEVVITGYGNTKKSQYVGASSKVDKKQIELVPIGSFDQILQGRVPGLRVSAGSGQPGAAASVQIRGPKSIGGGSTPLYIIDGVPVEAAVFQAFNPNDFESVDVLKDASAAALYGSRGASGVVVVTTKKGKSGKTQFSYRGQTGTTQPGTQKFNMMSTKEILQYQEDLGAFLPAINLPGWGNSTKNPNYINGTATQRARFDFLRDSIGSINNNWADLFQRNGNFTSHDLNLQGGSEKTTYFTSLSLYNEQGIGLRSDLKRYTLRANIDHKTDKLTFAFRMTGAYAKRNFIESENGVALANPFAASYLGVPYQELFLPNGQIATGAGRIGPNAYERTLNSKRYNDQIKTTTSVQATYNFTKSLYVGGQSGIDFRETVNTFWLDPRSFAASQSAFPTSTGAYSEDLGRYLQTQVRAYIGYKNTFKQRHNVDATVNFENIQQRTKSFGFTGYGLSAKLPNTPVAITPGTVANQLIPAVRGGKSQRAFLSYFANLKYNFDEKYFLDFTVRRDGASVISEKNRYNNFYAVGAVWNVLKEKFAANWSAFNSLRLRASYGGSANAENFPFGDFGYLPLYGQGNYAGLPTLVPSSVGNTNAQWEYADKFNVGIEFSMLKSRLTGEVNYYDEVTRNLFITQQIPSENGGAFTGASVNAGKMGNKGVEVQLSYSIVNTRSINWSVGGNFAYNKNTILDLGQQSEYPAGTAIIRKGLPLGSHYVVKWAGVDAATGAPLYYERDGKTTTRFNEADMSVAEFGTFFAPWTGGFNSDFSFNGFSVSAFFNFQQGFSRFNNQDFFQLNHAFAQQGYNLRREMSTMWKKPGDVTNIQSPLFQRQFSSKDVQDASYLRFRNLLISYTLPTSLMQKQRLIQSIRLYGQVQNLFTWTRWTGFDPEDNNNIAAYEYPLPRTYTFGIDVTF